MRTEFWALTTRKAKTMFKVVRENDNWEKLIDDDGNVIAESHSLDVEDVLQGLKIPYECEEIFDED